jgi:hypothetical protein
LDLLHLLEDGSAVLSRDGVICRLGRELASAMQRRGDGVKDRIGGVEPRRRLVDVANVLLGGGQALLEVQRASSADRIVGWFGDPRARRDLILELLSASLVDLDVVQHRVHHHLRGDAHQRAPVRLISTSSMESITLMTRAAAW